ncbi:hypothetical protein [Rhodococcus opacus]|uniref:hypothetical protein n=1 Tax=Rhodococcus opacus TaxID=37919 RepID=UPI0024B8F0B0|nr:hypothetical protein [Rhodococcus opacus]MDJ0418878.1 hypothetical protein [Rhodococcus opacus]
MCYPTPCPTCSKTTWGGCGQHADSVLRSVPAADRCTCTAGAAEPAKPGFFRALFGR